MHDEHYIRQQLRRIEDVITRQRVFLHRVPDPDTRESAEMHLLQLIEMRDELLSSGASLAE